MAYILRGSALVFMKFFFMTDYSISSLFFLLFINHFVFFWSENSSRTHPINSLSYKVKYLKVVIYFKVCSRYYHIYMHTCIISYFHTFILACFCTCRSTHRYKKEYGAKCLPINPSIRLSMIFTVIELPAQLKMNTYTQNWEHIRNIHGQGYRKH